MTLLAMYQEKPEITLLDVILYNLEEGLILIDKNQVVLSMNRAAGAILGVEDVDGAHGRKIDEVNGHLFASSREEYMATSPFYEVLRTGEAQYNVERMTVTGVHISVNFVPIERHGRIDGVLASIRDITKYKTLEENLLRANQELDDAFSLTLPNSKVMRKLKSTPEYGDVYLSDEGKILVTEIIPDGNYRHVINALKILADLHKQHVTELIGIDKDTLVQAILFHDIGKVQPELQVGDLVDPLEYFEDGKLHARRSAEVARHYYNKSDDVYELILYHHHREEELPESFPFRLLPMFRLLKLIDGLSAAITRRKAHITFEVHSSSITVWERNNHYMYHNIRTLDLFTGRQVINDWTE